MSNEFKRIDYRNMVYNRGAFDNDKLKKVYSPGNESNAVEQLEKISVRSKVHPIVEINKEMLAKEFGTIDSISAHKKKG